MRARNTEPMAQALKHQWGMSPTAELGAAFGIASLSLTIGIVVGFVAAGGVNAIQALFG